MCSRQTNGVGDDEREMKIAPTKLASMLFFSLLAHESQESTKLMRCSLHANLDDSVRNAAGHVKWISAFGIVQSIACALPWPLRLIYYVFHYFVIQLTFKLKVVDLLHAQYPFADILTVRALAFLMLAHMRRMRAEREKNAFNIQMKWRIESWRTQPMNFSFEMIELMQ